MALDALVEHWSGYWCRPIGAKSCLNQYRHIVKGCSPLPSPMKHPNDFATTCIHRMWFLDYQLQIQSCDWQKIIDTGNMYRKMVPGTLLTIPTEIRKIRHALAQVMAWCHQSPSHYMTQCQLGYLALYGVTGLRYVNSSGVLSRCKGAFSPV